MSRRDLSPSGGLTLKQAIAAREAELSSVGPFPQEPAPGSPEAVAQAAETIRSRVLDSAERDEVLDLLDRHRDAFEKREDELMAEVERLRGRLAYVHGQRAAAEAACDACERERREAVEQRDALADALVSEVAARRWRPISEWDSAPLGRLCEVGEEQDGTVYSREITARTDGGGKIHYRWTHFRECLNGQPDEAIAALRKAGR